MDLKSGSKFRGPIEDWIPWQIFLHGCYWAEREVEPVLLETARQSKVIFDVGAHMGYYTVQFAAQSSGQVHSFEPNPRSFGFLEQNVEINQLRNACLNHVGVSSQPGRLTLRIPHSGNSGSASFSQPYADAASDQVDVDVTTLTSYCERQNIEQIDMIKVDVEGHEFEVLKGLKTLLAQRRVWRIFTEWNSTTSSHSTYENLFGQLAESGYVAWTIANGKIVPFNQQHSSLVLFEAAEAPRVQRDAA